MLLGAGSRIVAVDRDPAAVRALERLAEDLLRGGAGGASPGAAAVVPVRADFRDPGSIPPVGKPGWDGALFANALHFVEDPGAVLRAIRPRLAPEGRLVVLEYDGRSASPWIPHPLPPGTLGPLAEEAGFSAPDVVSRRRSAYRGAIYCAVAFPVRSDPRPRPV